MKIVNGLVTTDNTEVHHEDKDKIKYNAPHHFIVINSNESNRILAEVNFQEGPTKEVGVNGIFNEDLIAMVLERLYHFQASEFACRENEMAMIKLEEALMWLRKRTKDRAVRGVLGTNNK